MNFKFLESFCKPDEVNFVLNICECSALRDLNKIHRSMKRRKKSLKYEIKENNDELKTEKAFCALKEITEV